MSEEPKRLAPISDVARELYVKSGNECAFPDCDHPIVNRDGTLIAEICHIEGVRPGSARFNPQQSNEERRGYANLLLMCHRHHKETDDEERFPVAHLQEIKQRHEAKFSGIVDGIEKQIVDLTSLDTPRPAQSLGRLNQALGWELSNDQLHQCLPELNEFAARIQRIPRNGRELLVVMASRSAGRALGSSGENVILTEIEMVTSKPRDYLVDLVYILTRHRLISEPYDNEDRQPQVDLLDLRSGWKIWDDLLRFSRTTGIGLSEIVTHLRFDLLD